MRNSWLICWLCLLKRRGRKTELSRGVCLAAPFKRHSGTTNPTSRLSDFLGSIVHFLDWGCFWHGWGENKQTIYKHATISSQAKSVVPIADSPPFTLATVGLLPLLLLRNPDCGALSTLSSDFRAGVSLVILFSGGRLLFLLKYVAKTAMSAIPTEALIRLTLNGLLIAGISIQRCKRNKCFWDTQFMQSWFRHGPCSNTASYTEFLLVRWARCFGWHCYWLAWGWTVVTLNWLEWASLPEITKSVSCLWKTAIWATFPCSIMALGSGIQMN